MVQAEEEASVDGEGANTQRIEALQNGNSHNNNNHNQPHVNTDNVDTTTITQENTSTTLNSQEDLDTLPTLSQNEGFTRSSSPSFSPPPTLGIPDEIDFTPEEFTEEDLDFSNDPSLAIPNALDTNENEENENEEDEENDIEIDNDIENENENEKENENENENENNGNVNDVHHGVDLHPRSSENGRPQSRNVSESPESPESQTSLPTILSPQNDTHSEQPSHPLTPEIPTENPLEPITTTTTTTETTNIETTSTITPTTTTETTDIKEEIKPPQKTVYENVSHSMHGWVDHTLRKFDSILTSLSYPMNSPEHSREVEALLHDMSDFFQGKLKGWIITKKEVEEEIEKLVEYGVSLVGMLEEKPIINGVDGAPSNSVNVASLIDQIASKDEFGDDIISTPPKKEEKQEEEKEKSDDEILNDDEEDERMSIVVSNGKGEILEILTQGDTVVNLVENGEGEEGEVQGQKKKKVKKIKVIKKVKKLVPKKKLKDSSSIEKEGEKEKEKEVVKGNLTEGVKESEKEKEKEKDKEKESEKEIEIEKEKESEIVVSSVVEDLPREKEHEKENGAIATTSTTSEPSSSVLSSSSNGEMDKSESLPIVDSELTGDSPVEEWENWVKKIEVAIQGRDLVKKKHEVKSVVDDLEKVISSRTNEISLLIEKYVGLCKILGEEKDEEFIRPGKPTIKRLESSRKRVGKLSGYTENLRKDMRSTNSEIATLRDELSKAVTNEDFEIEQGIRKPTAGKVPVKSTGKYEFGFYEKGDQVVVDQFVANVNLDDLISNWQIDSDKKMMETLSDKMEKEYAALREEKEKRLSIKQKYLRGVRQLYKKLAVPEDDPHRLAFNKLDLSGGSPEIIQLVKDEYERLFAFRREKVEKLINLTRKKLDKLWDEIQAPIAERQQVLVQEEVSDDYLDLLKAEVAKLEAYIESIRPILDKIKRREWYKTEMVEFESKAGDPKRLKGSSLQLLEEERFRKGLAKEFPQLTKDLRVEIAQWEKQYYPLRIVFRGQSYLGIMGAEQESPDFELLHLKLLTTKKKIAPAVGSTTITLDETGDLGVIVTPIMPLVGKAKSRPTTPNTKVTVRRPATAPAREKKYPSSSPTSPNVTTQSNPESPPPLETNSAPNSPFTSSIAKPKVKAPKTPTKS